ncbi:GNAT family N-acetyltransferase [Anoxynatronum buryatiense]|uniref:Acetyltransferase (GNAT) domain-containing protein n=1 Tax=Anoxynatronum buryatiense TaxID=489973 RepID=A0AA45WZ70_9CLOT|nr:GNAT family N-acetyltransferase [Anoxynatronum buryatiense]SMP66702.1 Acetyltransferase (GNAT) domain-containing protein [Anoxynatronum buryatiense]
MTYSFQHFHHARDLPATWDAVCHKQPWLHQQLLTQLETLNPCNQQYYLSTLLKTAFVTYHLKIDPLALKTSLGLKLPATIVGMPLSLSVPGYAATPPGLEAMATFIRQQSGLWMILNATEQTAESAFPFPCTPALPACSMPIAWDTFDAYLAALRSHYRHRLKKALNRGRSLTVSILPEGAPLPPALYRLYEQVYRRSPHKLEKLSPLFFQHFPAEIHSFYLEEQPVGFVQLTVHQQEMTFLFCGFEKQLTTTHDLYQNMLLYLVRQAIDRHCHTLHLGQTAVETKQKLGARLEPRSLYLHHSQPLVRHLARHLTPLLGYRDTPSHYRVFRDSLSGYFPGENR